MRLHICTLLLAALAAASPASAQCFVHPPGATPVTGASGFLPFGSTDVADPVNSDIRYQVQVPASVFNNQPARICELYAAPLGTRDREWTQFQVRMGHNGNGMGTNMAANTQGFTAIVVGTQDSSTPTTTNTWWPLGMTVPFDFNPAFGDLLIEFRMLDCGAPTGTGSAAFRTSSSVPYVWNNGPSYRGTIVPSGGVVLRFCTDAANLIEYGAGGCVGTNGLAPQLTYSGTPRLGQAVNIHLSDAVVRPNAFAVLMLSDRVRSGSFSLQGVGAPNCDAYVFGNQAVWLTTSTGALTKTYNLPLTLSACVPVWNQWFVFDPGANGLGVVSSNYGRMLIGN